MKAASEPLSVPAEGAARTATETTAPDSPKLPSAAPRVHLAFLDGVRALAAGYVVLHHAAFHAPVNSSRLGARLLSPFRFGHYAVDVFIVLSGYCLMLPVWRASRPLDVRKFLVRRAVRILPPYYLAMLGSWLLIATVIGQETGSHWDNSTHVSRLDLWLHALLIQDLSWGSAFKINHAHWSIAVEWKIYFAFPLLLVLWRRIGPLTTVALATLSSYAVWFLFYELGVLNTGPWGMSTYYLGLFAMGMLAAEVAETGAIASSPGARAQLRRSMLRWLAVASGAVVVISLRALDVPLQARSLFIGIWAALLLVVLRLGALPRPVLAALASRPATWLGKRGFSLYLTHAPILQLVYLAMFRMSRIPRASHPALMVFVGVPVCLLAAAGFFWAVELPFHRISRGLGPSS